MGADGHIAIWNDETVREQFPEWDIDELFACLPTHYVDDLDGVTYHHCYWGDNMWVHWSDAEDWYLPHDWVKERTPDQEETRQRVLDRLPEFVDWLEKNYTHWEVWT